MDVGICMSREVLADKLALREGRNPEAAWNLRVWPEGFVEGASNRLFVACGGKWIGYFRMGSDMLYNRHDRATPYTMLFDTRTWTRIEPVPAPRFRGFTYDVPAVGESGVKQSGQAAAARTTVEPAEWKTKARLNQTGGEDPAS